MAVTFRYLEGRAAPVPRKRTSSTSLSACMDLYFSLLFKQHMCSTSEMTIVGMTTLLNPSSCPVTANFLSYPCMRRMRKNWEDLYLFNAQRHIAGESVLPLFWQIQGLEHLWMSLSQATLRS